MSIQPPARPRPPRSLVLATADEDDLRDGGVHRAVGFYDLALTGRTAKGAEFVQCRFNRADLAGTALIEATLTDCLVEDTGLADLRADRCGLERVAVRGSRLTGLHWADGTLRDVTVRDCQAAGSVYRGTAMRAVVFTATDLTGADFSGADLSGAAFVRCDLSGARFTGATATGARFEACTLTSVDGLAGATIAAQDLGELSRLLAAGLGISLEATAASPDPAPPGSPSAAR
ncbi:pentapeptide repeat-containing protein [Dactylosporangium sp. CA-092794]|uniref:pentapeptide repeat-containing protein n=1 Tax=Dactylosporangium sp. CA-092794 TaxID=3239929 RepID=UPI003D8EFA22